VAWMTRPVITSPWIVLDAVRVLAVIPNACALDMVVKPLIFRAPLIFRLPLMLPDTLRLVVLIVDAPSLTKFATAFGLFVTILPPDPTSPRAILEPEPTTLRF